MAKSILGISGNRAMNYLLRTIVEEKFHYIPVSNVYEGTLLLKKDKNIGLIILDVDYEPEYAWEMVNHIKISKLFELPIFILSSVNNEDIVEKCLYFGIEDMFFKPFNPVEIINAATSSLYAQNELQISKP